MKFRVIRKRTEIETYEVEADSKFEAVEKIEEAWDKGTIGESVDYWESQDMFYPEDEDPTLD